ncbi:MAG TPA: DUF4350 domain-containing protein [Methanoregula sp.]|nr:DUF4350 domain-containing protein [Methanoregula sp.]
MRVCGVRNIRYAFAAAGLVLLISALILTAHLSTNNLEFSQYNTNWNGTSQFFSGLDRHHTVMVTKSTQLEPYRGEALLLILAPYRMPDDEEITAYQKFLDKGNTLLLADDFGTGSAILKQIGSRITITRGNLSSVDRQYADPYTVVVYRRGNSTLFSHCNTLITNRPAAVEGGDAVMTTSVLSWVDLDGDRRLRAPEAMGQYTVIAQEDISRGRIIVISDPSIFINTMLEPDQPGDNLACIQDLIRSNRTVLVDQMNSRTRDTEGMSEILHLIRTTIPVNVLFLTLLVLAVAVVWRRKMV